MLTDMQRAMLGDHEAAKRLTEQGVLVPCPMCKGEKAKVECKSKFAGTNGLDWVVKQHAYSVRCNICHARGPIKSGKVMPGFPIMSPEYDLPSWATTDCELSYQARLAWNTRAPILSAEEIDMLERSESS